MLNNNNNNISSVGNGASAAHAKRSGTDRGTSEDSAVVSSQRTPNNNSGSRKRTNATVVGYGGTEGHEMNAMSRARDDGGDAAVSVQPRSDGRRREREGECVVVVSNNAECPDTCIDRLQHFLLNNDPLLYAVLKWGLSALLLLFLTFIVFGMLYSGVHYSNNCTAAANTTGVEAMPGPCRTHFGTILGTFENTFSYSNCNDDYVSIFDSYMNLTVPKVDAATGALTMTSHEFYTGLKWQCVEYARRYWMINGRPKPAYFGSVDVAADIWNLTEVHLLENTSQTLPLRRYKNGDRVMEGLQPPQSGDILIYPVQPGGFPAGHVAVIAKVEMTKHGAVYVAEQNWGSMQWPEPFHNFSRRIPLHYDPLTTAVMLNDPAGKIMGWMRYG